MPIRIFRAVVSVLAVASIICAQPAEAHRGSEAVFSSPQPPAADVPSVAATGTVQDLVIDNRVSGAATRYLWLRLDDGSTVALRGSSLDALIPGQRVEVTGRNAGQTLFVSSTRALAMAPAKAAGAKAPVALSVQGRLALAHADFFNEGRGEYSVHVISDDGKATVL